MDSKYDVIVFGGGTAGITAAIRVECPGMAMGQAAGAMAALSYRTGIDPGAIPIKDLHSVLREHGAIVPGDVKI